MRLFIAEKPELAKAIAAVLGPSIRADGHIVCGDDRITWCFGHMLQLLEPEDYDPRFAEWSMDHLPIVQIPWSRRPMKDKAVQLKVITALIKQADRIVHAGDPDSEGQLLVDAVLAHASNTKPVDRLLINDNTPAVVRRALASMRPNSDFAGLSAAADARSVGDQAYGFNLTRAYTLAARAKGFSGVLSVGRVQTPVLGLVVRRDRAFEAHTSTFYYVVSGPFSFGDIIIPAKYMPTEIDEVDHKKRLVDAGAADRIATSANAGPVSITSATTTPRERPAPLPYNLLRLQSDAAKRFGLKPDRVKEITQALRETHQLITYNRSDCEYLSEDQHVDAPGVLAAVAATAPAFAALVKHANPALKSRAFDTSKVTAHHAIIPTAKSGDYSKLSGDEQKIYLLIARAYIGQFFPTCLVDETRLVIAAGIHQFAATTTVVTRPGWQQIYASDAVAADDDDDNEAIAIDARSLSAGDAGSSAVSVKKEKTKPKPRYTISTLLTALTRVANEVKDPALRAVLQSKDAGKSGEHGGIGTPATRDTIIATLFDRGMLVDQGKAVVSTPLAREFYDALPDNAKFPDMTAIWHQQQQEIERGTLSAEAFVTELRDYIATQVDDVQAHGLNIAVPTAPCPDCGAPAHKRSGKHGAYWQCSVHAEHRANDDNGKPRARATTSDVHQCQSCGKGLIRRTSAKGPWWGCSGYPSCKQTYSDQNGRPEVSPDKKGASNANRPASAAKTPRRPSVPRR